MARSTTHHFSVFSLMSPFFSDPWRWWERGHQRSWTLACGSPVEGDGDGGAPAWRGWGWWGAGGSSLSSAPPLLLFLYRRRCRRGGGWRGGALASRAERRRLQLELNSSALPSLLLSPPALTAAPAQPWAAAGDELHGERRGWSSVTTTEDEDLRCRG
jgi:hypothetical protein